MLLHTPSPETVFLVGHLFGAIEVVKATCGVISQILDPSKDGYNLTIELNLEKLPQDEGSLHYILRLL